MREQLRKAFSYKGNKRKRNYFEGWYYKIVSKDKKNIIALIPGISLNNVDSHSFIQVFLYEYNKEEDDYLETHYLKMDVDSFHFLKSNGELIIDKNLFSLDKIVLNHTGENNKFKGEINFTNMKPINTSVLSPSIMGIFSYIPFMECYHSIVSMAHNTKGSITLNNKTYNFDDGLGYIEKDYGKSFPKEYIWLQSNHFKNERTSFMFSYAIIPFMGLSFKGLIANLVVGDVEYRFATYNNAKTTIIEITEDFVNVEVTRKKQKLQIKAQINNVVNLPSPIKGKMINTIKEGLSGKIEIKLFDNDEIIYEDTGLSAGIELMMN